MVRTRSIEEVDRERVRGSLEAFLDGKKDLNWIKGVMAGRESYNGKESFKR